MNTLISITFLGSVLYMLFTTNFPVDDYVTTTTFADDAVTLAVAKTYDVAFDK